MRVDLFLKCTALVVVAGVTADRTQAIRGEGDETGLGQAPRDVLDVRVEPAVFMDDHHRRDLAGGFCRTHQIGAHLPVALGRGVGDVLGDDVRVGEFDLFGKGVIRAQGRQQRTSGQATQGEQRGAVEKFAPVDQAMGVVVVEFQQLRGKVFCSETGHRCASSSAD
ncbi:hypothetical protein D3C76_1165050 [compost metagenome]